MKRYRKKPVVIEAMLHDGTVAAAQAIIAWADLGSINPDGSLTIWTQEGWMKADVGDYVIREPFPTETRRFYPCKPDIFAATYEPVTP